MKCRILLRLIWISGSKKWAENEFDATDMQLRTEHRMLQDPNGGLEAIIQRAPVDAPDL